MSGKVIGMIVVLLVVTGVIWLAPSFGPTGQDEQVVTCYAALDEEFSRPLLEAFEKQTGIRVDMKFDAESTKTIGLVNRIKEEHQQGHPTCDVFWNNEVVNTVRLKKLGALAEYRPKAAAGFPEKFKDPDGTWTGFAARSRVLIVNTDLVKADEMPRTTEDLLGERWKGQLGIAKPLYGSTATWVAALYARSPKAGGTGTGLETLSKIVKTQEIRILDGNKRCAEAVGRGDLAAAFTDTDDAVVEKESGNPVELIFLDTGEGQRGTLFFPNTLAIIKNCPHRENAEALVEYLLSPEVEAALATGPSAQIPINPAVKERSRAQPPKDAELMQVDWDTVADTFDEAMAWVRTEFGL